MRDCPLWGELVEAIEAIVLAAVVDEGGDALSVNMILNEVLDGGEIVSDSGRISESSELFDFRFGIAEVGIPLREELFGLGLVEFVDEEGLVANAGVVIFGKEAVEQL